MQLVTVKEKEEFKTAQRMVNFFILFNESNSLYFQGQCLVKFYVPKRCSISSNHLIKQGLILICYSNVFYFCSNIDLHVKYYKMFIMQHALLKSHVSLGHNGKRHSGQASWRSNLHLFALLCHQSIWWCKWMSNEHLFSLRTDSSSTFAWWHMPSMSGAMI